MSRTKPQELSPEEIVAWAQHVSGIKQYEIARSINVTQKTISNWIKKVKAFIGDKFEIENNRLPQYGLYPLAIQSLVFNLKRNDVQTTIAVLKGLNILTEKYEHEVTDLRSKTNEELIAELGKMGYKVYPVEMEKSTEQIGQVS